MRFLNRTVIVMRYGKVKVGLFQPKKDEKTLWNNGIIKQIQRCG